MTLMETSTIFTELKLDIEFKSSFDVTLYSLFDYLVLANIESGIFKGTERL